jgi:hypothetical protein
MIIERNTNIMIIVVCIILLIVGIILTSMAKYTRSVTGKFMEGTVDGANVVVTKASYVINGENYIWMANAGDRLLIPSTPAPVAGVTDVKLYYDPSRAMQASYKSDIGLSYAGYAMIIIAAVVLLALGYSVYTGEVVIY